MGQGLFIPWGPKKLTPNPPTPTSLASKGLRSSHLLHTWLDPQPSDLGPEEAGSYLLPLCCSHQQ